LKPRSKTQSAVAFCDRVMNIAWDKEVTKHSGDGGIDIEAEKDGLDIIVQAKRYSSKVGVAVVREMAGVREARGGSPKTIIFALSGFTRGAKDLAYELNIELRSIRNELLTD